MHKTDGVIKVYSDIFHGSQYLEEVQKKKIKDTSIVFMSGMDGAMLYHHKLSDCWIYIFVNLEYDPQICYKKKHVMIGSVFPGPNKPKNHDSFLFPGVYHISAIQQEGLQIWDASTGKLFKGDPYFMFNCADAPGSLYFSGLVPHHATLGCWLFCGFEGCNKPGTPHYYPALLLPDDYPPEKMALPDWDPHDIWFGDPLKYSESLKYILQSTTERNYKIRRKNTGISRPSLLIGLPKTHQPPITGMLVGDLMHTATLNAGDLFLSLWRGAMKLPSTDSIDNWPWAVFSDEATWIQHGKAVENALPYIPGSFDKAPRNIAEKINSGYKAKEWQAYLYGLAPSLLYGVLPLEYWKNYCQYVAGMRILHQRYISYEDVTMTQELLNQFLIDYEKLYVQRRTDRIYMVRSWLYTLAHGGKEISRVGPGGLLSTWMIECTIGNLGEEIRQPSNPYANLSEQALK